MMKHKFSVSRDIWSDGISFRMAESNGKDLFVAVEVKFKKIDPCEHYGDPLFRMSESDAQELANQLYAAGIKPEQAAGSAGQLDAVRFHLEDMRKLVFKEQ